MMKRLARDCLLWALSLPVSHAAAQKIDLDEFLKPTAKAAAPEQAGPAQAEAPATPASTHPASAPPKAAAATSKVGAPPKTAAAATSAAPRATTHVTKPTEDAAEPSVASAPKPDAPPVASSSAHHAGVPASAHEPASKTSRVEKPKRVKKKTAYDLLCEGWHAPPEPALVKQWRASAIPDLVFRVHKTGETYALKPSSAQGGFDETQLQIAKQAFQSWGPTPHPRTLDLVYAAALHFNAPYVTLISGVRKDRGGSRHSHGLAADIVLPGIEDETLAAFFRAQGFCGVGTYPRSGFVHVDTRDSSYFWVDNSKPNQHGRVVQVRKEESAAADAAALARGASFVNPPKLQRALNVRLIRKRKLHRAKLERAAAQSATATQPKAPVSTASP